MHSVTYNNIGSKCYLNVFTTFPIVPKRMGSTNVLARAIDKFKLFFINLKKIHENYNINFLTIIRVLSFSSFSILQTILSPLLISNSVTISLGIVHLNESEWGAA